MRDHRRAAALLRSRGGHASLPVVAEHPNRWVCKKNGGVFEHTPFGLASRLRVVDTTHPDAEERKSGAALCEDVENLWSSETPEEAVKIAPHDSLLLVASACEDAAP